jgi:hypothetical protein
LPRRSRLKTGMLTREWHSPWIGSPPSCGGRQWPSSSPRLRRALSASPSSKPKGLDLGSPRRECRVLGQCRSRRGKPRVIPDDEPRLVDRRVALAIRSGRKGDREVAEQFPDEASAVNHKPVERLWPRERLKLPPRQSLPWTNCGGATDRAVSGPEPETGEPSICCTRSTSNPSVKIP